MPRKRKTKPNKICCEICDEHNEAVLHYHHIIERTNVLSTEEYFNICVICSNCHNKVHDGQIKIIGLYPSTKLPYKRTLIYEQNGESNLPGIDRVYCKIEPKSMKLFGKKE